MAANAGMNVFLVEYALCPEEPFPRNVKDCVAAYMHLTKDRGIDPKNLQIFGESAGKYLF